MKTLNKGALANMLKWFTLLFVVGAISSNAHAGLLNSDFSAGADGLDDWEGFFVWDGGSASEEYEGPIVSPFSALVSTVPGTGSVTINNGFLDVDGDTNTIDNDVFLAVLFQEFDFDPLGAGVQLWLSMDISATKSDPGDIADVVLFDLDTIAPLPFIEFQSGVAVDVTAWAGISASLEFSAIDLFGFNNGESITVSNILFEQRTVVPEPSLFFLMILMSLAVLRRVR